MKLFMKIRFFGGLSKKCLDVHNFFSIRSISRFETHISIRSFNVVSMVCSKKVPIIEKYWHGLDVLSEFSWNVTKKSNAADSQKNRSDGFEPVTFFCARVKNYHFSLFGAWSLNGPHKTPNTNSTSKRGYEQTSARAQSV